MAYNLIECSPQAKAKIKSTEDKVGVKDEYHNARYPLNSMKIGQAFAVEFSEVKESSLRSVVATRAASLSKKFAIIKHEEQKLYEVARIA